MHQGSRLDTFWLFVARNIVACNIVVAPSDRACFGPFDVGPGP